MDQGDAAMSLTRIVKFSDFTGRLAGVQWKQLPDPLSEGAKAALRPLRGRADDVG